MKILSLLVLLLTGSLFCQGQDGLRTLSGQALGDEWKSSPITVLIFMSPECPLCENYAATLKTLRPLFPEHEVAFVGVFSGNWYTSEEITRYMARYQPPVEVILDPGYMLRDQYHATVTPEAVLLSASGEVIYQGKIDNWIVSLGKKRTVVNEYYLRDALEAWTNGQYPEIRQTEAVGCFIE